MQCIIMTSAKKVELTSTRCLVMSDLDHAVGSCHLLPLSLSRHRFDSLIETNALLPWPMGTMYM